MTGHKKVALFMSSLSGGGAEQAMINIAHGLSELDLSVDLVVTRAKGPLLDKIPEGVRLVDLGVSRIANSLIPLTKYFISEKPYAMLSAMRSPNVIAVWARLLSRVSCRLILAEHTHLDRDGTPGFRLWVNRMLMPISYRLSDGVVAVSNGVADSLTKAIGIPRRNVKVVSNPIPIQEIACKSLEALEHPWFQDGAPPVVLSVGRLVEAKDFPLLIHAFAKLKDAKDARLMILGEGEMRSVLEKLASALGIRESVCMLGYVSNPYAYMGKARAFVLSSRREGLPTVLIEALACGLPVVSTDCPSGPREILENGRWGTLTPVGDCQALSAAILEALESEKNTGWDRAKFYGENRAIQDYARMLLG
jgi:glycosyltransferase involved in cell wall biosynthesis